MRAEWKYLDFWTCTVDYFNLFERLNDSQWLQMVKFLK